MTMDNAPNSLEPVASLEICKLRDGYSRSVHYHGEPSKLGPGIHHLYAHPAPKPDCVDCYGSGEIFTHSDNCNNDRCALNGDMDSCQGKVETCANCHAAPAPKPADSQLVEVDSELIARVDHVMNAGVDRWKVANLTGYDWRRILAALRFTLSQHQPTDTAAQLAEARDRIEDMLKGDDGQAWAEARKFVDKVRASQHHSPACPSCNGLNTSCPDGCGRDPETGELDGTRLQSPADAERDRMPTGMRHVAYFDEGKFHWMSGIAPRDCELYAFASGAHREAGE